MTLRRNLFSLACPGASPPRRRRHRGEGGAERLRVGGRRHHCGVLNSEAVLCRAGVEAQISALEPRPPHAHAVLVRIELLPDVNKIAGWALHEIASTNIV